jgi:hypothetical protein
MRAKNRGLLCVKMSPDLYPGENVFWSMMSPGWTHSHTRDINTDRKREKNVAGPNNNIISCWLFWCVYYGELVKSGCRAEVDAAADSIPEHTIECHLLIRRWNFYHRALVFKWVQIVISKYKCSYLWRRLSFHLFLFVFPSRRWERYSIFVSRRRSPFKTLKDIRFTSLFIREINDNRL